VGPKAVLDAVVKRAQHRKNADISMHRAVFEPMIPMFEGSKT